MARFTQYRESVGIDSPPTAPQPAANTPPTPFQRSLGKCLSNPLKGRACLYAPPERRRAAARAAQPAIHSQPTTIHLSPDLQSPAPGPGTPGKFSHQGQMTQVRPHGWMARHFPPSP
ncbi:hypothetical protein NDU88_004352 [Pleurodeles waltl]|uniref:Uncharacterized protein n=1 Tax=Pleurodeles waltl TaxID=8319 RepID=A0AAV7VKH1_PLEWA|nr:hypothetical protein NDU88_004352 [Pleurodeles waltl]